MSSPTTAIPIFGRFMLKLLSMAFELLPPSQLYQYFEGHIWRLSSSRKSHVTGRGALLQPGAGRQIHTWGNLHHWRKWHQIRETQNRQLSLQRLADWELSEEGNGKKRDLKCRWDAMAFQSHRFVQSSKERLTICLTGAAILVDRRRTNDEKVSSLNCIRAELQAERRDSTDRQLEKAMALINLADRWRKCILKLRVSKNWRDDGVQFAVAFKDQRRQQKFATYRISVLKFFS
jgi:hypothetical protein